MIFHIWCIMARVNLCQCISYSLPLKLIVILVIKYFFDNSLSMPKTEAIKSRESKGEKSNYTEFN